MFGELGDGAGEPKKRRVEEERYRIRFHEDPLMYVDFPGVQEEDAALAGLRVIAQGIARDESIPWQHGAEYKFKVGSMGGPQQEAKKSMIRILIGAALEHFRAFSIQIWLRRGRVLSLRRMDRLEVTPEMLRYVHHVLSRSDVTLYRIKESRIMPILMYPMSFALHEELGGVELVLARQDSATRRLNLATIVFNDEEFNVKIERDRIWGKNESEEILLRAEAVTLDASIPWLYMAAVNGIEEHAVKRVHIDGELLETKRRELVRKTLILSPVATEIWFLIVHPVYIILRVSGYSVTIAGVEHPAAPTLVHWAFQVMWRERNYVLHNHRELICQHNAVVPADILMIAAQLRSITERVLRCPFINQGQRDLDMAQAAVMHVPNTVDDQNVLVITFPNAQFEHEFKQVRYRGHSP